MEAADIQSFPQLVAEGTILHLVNEPNPVRGKATLMLLVLTVVVQVNKLR